MVKMCFFLKKYFLRGGDKIFIFENFYMGNLNFYKK
jgi:hypothetical protein